MARLTINCSPRDAIGKSRVEVTDSSRPGGSTGGVSNYTDSFNPDDAFRRSKFAEAVCLHFGWEFTTENFQAIEKCLAEAVAVSERAETTERYLDLVSAADIEPTEMRWLWEGKIPLGKVTMLAGDPGLGKSVLTLELAAAVSRGRELFDGEQANDGVPGRVLIFSAEDDANDTMVPRLIAADADMSRVVFGNSVIERCRQREDKSHIDLFTDISAIETALRNLQDVKLLVIDPITAYLGAVGENSNAEVRKLLHPLSRLASEYGVAILCVTHLRKQKGRSLYRFIGSVGFVAAARSAWLVRRTEDSGNRRYMQPIKSNVATAEGSLIFSLCESPENGAPYIEWLGYANGDASDVAFAGDGGRGRPALRMQQAVSFLRDLAGAKGYVLGVHDVQSRARAENIAQRTLQRALAKLGWKSTTNAEGALVYEVPVDEEVADAC